MDGINTVNIEHLKKGEVNLGVSDGWGRTDTTGTHTLTFVCLESLDRPPSWL